MKVTRIYSGSDGESHFEDIEIPFKNTRPVERQTEPVPATSVTFREQSEGFMLWDFHVAPHRQYVFTLKGKNEIIASDGTKRQFGPGDVLLAEDTSGRGHKMRVLGPEPRISIAVTLDQDR